MDDIDNEYIIDASVVLAWLLPDEIYQDSANYILELYRKKIFNLVSPALLPYEIINGIRTSILRKRINLSSGEEMIMRYKALDIDFIRPDEKNILQISSGGKISAYDGTYASLIMLRNKNLITADKKLLRNLREIEIKKVIWISDFR